MDTIPKVLLYPLIFGYLLTFINAEIIVTLPNGKIRGLELTTANKLGYYGFFQVPYAAPPVGNLRFKSPTSVQNWDGILNTTSNEKICYQWGGSVGRENEDCLYLNIFTPVKPGTDAKLPVMIFIHGGTFLSGSCPGTTSENFMEYDIIAVTINYRLGPFGFLSTEDTVIPGNFGLKDQTFAFKWVKENIQLFGGDPEKVVINGQSAGASSIGYQILSKTAKGLFRGGILESGTALCSYAFRRDARKYAYMMAKAVDQNFNESSTSEEVLALLQSVPASKINLAKVTAPADEVDQETVFAPVVEPPHKDAFLTQKMHERLLEGDINRVPIIIGSNSEERISEGADLVGLKKKMAVFDNNITLIVKKDYHVTDYNKRVEAGNILRDIYTNGGKFQDNPGASIRFWTDVRYTTSIYTHALLQSNVSDVYLYEFSYHGNLSHNDIYVEGADRVGHSEELNYIWHYEDISKYPKEDILTHKRLLTMWTNFVKFLNPTPEKSDLLQNVTWPKVTPTSLQYLNINGSLEVAVNPKQYDKWASVINTYGNPPFDSL